MKTTSRFALAAAAGLFVGAMAFTPAQAADLGGDCCADLEERVAELEATTVRKGNRVMSVQISGNVDQAILIWDDGFDSDAYVVDNSESGTDMQIRGTGNLKPGWTTGFFIDLDLDTGTASGEVSQFEDDSNDGNVSVDDAEVFIESVQLGRLSIGNSSMATDGIAEISLGGGKMSYATGSNLNGGFIIRSTNGLAYNAATGAEDSFVETDRVTWADVNAVQDGGDADRVRYDSPAIYGFILSAAAGEDDIVDVALRFSKEWNSIQFAAGIGYSNDTEPGADVEFIAGSASIKHVPTGLWATFAAGEQETEGAAFDPTNYYVGAGITKNFFGPGDTTLYAEYSHYEDNALAGDETTQIGLGFTQQFDSAATEIYIQAEHWEYDNPLAGEPEAENWQGVMTGMNVKF